MAQSNLKTEVTLAIDSMTHGRYGIGRNERRAVMVPGTVPGDRVRARVIMSKPRYDIAELSAVIAPAAARRQPPCPYVGSCGGCPWQQIAYEEQLAAKTRNVEDALRRTGKLDGFTLQPIIAAPAEFHYRRRIQLRVDAHKRLGFSPSASHDIVPIDACAIAAPTINEALEAVRRVIRESATVITEVEIVSGDERHQMALVLHAAGPLADSDRRIFEQLIAFGAVQGIVVKAGGKRICFGSPRITVVIEPGIDLEIAGDVFIQVNSAANQALVQRLIAAGEFAPDDRVLELYCGAGNFTFSIARRAAEVIAVEGDRQALDGARQNAQRLVVENIRWRAAALPQDVAQLARNKERFSKIVLDPPRAGAKGIDRELAALGAERIIYVSCNPPTLARDVAALTTRGYKLIEAQPIDLFPQTFHVETIAVLERI
jgi:23S rRNA (uracil1939-C5)-methyltransferase